MSSTTSSASLAHASSSQRGMRAWLAVLSPRDRVIYGVLMTVMLAVIGIYMVLAVQLLLSLSPGAAYEQPAVAADTTATATMPADSIAESSPTATVAELLTTPSPTARVTASPTPTSQATQNTAATSTVGETPTPTARAATDSVRAAPRTSSSMTTVAGQPIVTLYFRDATDTLFVQVSRALDAQLEQANDAEIALQVIRALLAGPTPQSGFVPSVSPNVSIKPNGIVARSDRLTIDFSVPPATQQELQAMALTLTELPMIQRVQFLHNGTTLPVNGRTAIGRFAFNIFNPQGLPETFDAQDTRFLPLYFLAEGSSDRYIRVTQLVPRTMSPARETVEQLLAASVPFDNLLSSPIPPNTTLLDIGFVDTEKREIRVNLSQSFAAAANRRAALDTLLLSLTNVPIGNGEFIERVQVQVEGAPLETFWGAEYAQPFFERPILNRE